MSVELRVYFVETDGKIGGTESLEIGDASTELEVAIAHGVSRQVLNMIRFAEQMISCKPISSVRRDETNQKEKTKQENDK